MRQGWWCEDDEATRSDGSPVPLEKYTQQFDDLFSKLNQAKDFAASLQGLLFPTERNKTLTGLANTEPTEGAQQPRAQGLQWFVSESNWDQRQVQERRLRVLREFIAN